MCSLINWPASLAPSSGVRCLMPKDFIHSGWEKVLVEELFEEKGC